MLVYVDVGPQGVDFQAETNVSEEHILPPSAGLKMEAVCSITLQFVYGVYFYDSYNSQNKQRLST
jgi:hypothetical protein